jgi:hypothetical protein
MVLSMFPRDSSAVPLEVAYRQSVSSICGANGELNTWAIATSWRTF